MNVETPQLLNVALLGTVWIIPFALLMVTSFVKISVVLGILRNAIGAPEVPSTLVITGVALVLSAHIMTPTAQAVAHEAAPWVQKGAKGDSASVLVVVEKAAAPVREFLFRHSGQADRALFRDLATRLGKRDAWPTPTERDFGVLAPAFVVGELASAFRIGFLVFVPFLVVDLVVANILLALGLTAMSPAAVSLPFKLLLFVMVDGWRLLVRGLVLGYT